MPSPTESVMQMFLMSLTNFGAVYEAFSFTEHEVVAKVNTFKIYMVTLTNVNSFGLGIICPLPNNCRSSFNQHVNRHGNIIT